MRDPGSTLETITAADASYPAYQHVYVARGAPRVVFVPRTAAEVVDALQRSRSLPGPLSIRSGGHGISSVATNVDGTVIDLRRMNTVERLDADHVRIGPGARWGAVAATLVPWGLAISSGDSGDVGVGGLATSGGVGLMGRMHGLAIDNLMAVEIVTADGQIRRASEQADADLFWAVRGAGANVGIVTAFDFRASRSPRVGRLSMNFAVTEPAAFLQLWGETVEAAPREISAFLYLGAGPRPGGMATVVYAGDDPASIRHALQPFVELPGVQHADARIIPYSAVPLTTGAPHTGQQGARTRSGLVDHLGADTAAALADVVANPSTAMVQVRSVGGAINDLASDDTAYAHRSQNFSVTGMTMTPNRQFDDAWSPFRDRTNGTYLSFESDHEPGDLQRAFPLPTLARLRDVKRRWDPDSVFTQNFNVAAS